MSLIEEVKRQDHEEGVILPRARSDKASMKWIRFVQQADLYIPLDEWCHRFPHEELLDEWDAERNGALKPTDISRASSQLVWWTSADCGHSRQQSVRRPVFAGGGCIYCNRLCVLPCHSTAECLDVSLLAKWHPTKNSDLTPDMVSDRTKQIFWWQCPKYGHEWKIPIVNRLKTPDHDPGCPHCDNRKVWRGYNDFATEHPNIAALWHPRTNKQLKPTNVLSDASRVVR